MGLNESRCCLILIDKWQCLSRPGYPGWPPAPGAVAKEEKDQTRPKHPNDVEAPTRWKFEGSSLRLVHLRSSFHPAPLRPHNPLLTALLSPFADRLCPAAFPQLSWTDAPVRPSVCRVALSPAAVAFTATARPSSGLFSRFGQAITLNPFNGEECEVERSFFVYL
jgi:hypothetical protein